jgi:nucleoside-diphosphate-sugar epimerase
MAETPSESDYAGRRVLVTGASGFIGARLCARLAALGAEVTATSRTPFASESSIAWQHCDLSDASATENLIGLARPERVFHLASHVVGTRATSAVFPTFESNLVSTVNLLTAAERSGCQRVVLTGSLEEPDPGPEWPIPSSPYAAAKLAANAYGRMFHALFGLPVVILRVFMVYGPGQRDHAKLVPYVITSLLKGETPRLGSGLREVDWIYVDDVVDALGTTRDRRHDRRRLRRAGDYSTRRRIAVRDDAAERNSGLRRHRRPTHGTDPGRRHCERQHSDWVATRGRDARRFAADNRLVPHFVKGKLKERDRIMFVRQGGRRAQ